MIYGIIVGIIAGFVASKLYSGHGKGCVINCILGLLGGAFGGWIFTLLGIHWGGCLGEIGTGVVGAVALLWIANKVLK